MRRLPILVLAGLAFTASAALATHGTATIVDSIDGSGPGTYNGTLSNTDDTADWYSFSGAAGTSVTITMNSGAFDTFLTLYSTPGVPAAGDDRSTYTFVAENDDFNGLNSQIDVVLPTTGNYVVAGESFSGEEDPLGAYELTISGNVTAVGGGRAGSCGRAGAPSRASVRARATYGC